MHRAVEVELFAKTGSVADHPPESVSRIKSMLHGRGHVKYDCISRAESASPATGSHKAHVIEQQQILKAAFDPR